MKEMNGHLVDPIPLPAKTNREMSDLLKDVPWATGITKFEQDVLLEVGRRLRSDMNATREMQKAFYKFKIGDLVELKRNFSPRWGQTLEGSSKVMQIIGHDLTEARIAIYYALPIDDLDALPQHQWRVKEEDLKIPMNPQND